MLRYIKFFVIYPVAICLLLSGGFVLYRSMEGDRLLSVQTSSMVPAFYPGDAVVTQKVSLSNLKVGDIISYLSPADNRVVVSHRLIGINYRTGRLITAGDALDLQDVPFPSSLLLGRVTKILPGAGYPLDWLHRPIGLAVVVYLPASLVLISETKRLAKQYKKPQYQQYGYSLGNR